VNESKGMSEDDDMPCGRCDVGVYSESACMTPLAYRMAAAVDSLALVPRCKRFDRPCVGATHFAQAIQADRPGWEEIAFASEPPLTDAQVRDQDSLFGCLPTATEEPRK